MDWAIRTEHLTKIYNRRLVAVNDLCLDVPRGCVFGLLGPNGAGKTTTLRLLLGVQRPNAGTAQVLGQPCGPNAVALRRLIGYLPTHPKLPGHLRPIEYLDLLGQLYRMPSEERKPRVASLLRAVGLLAATGQRISTFSTGMITRLGIAASLVGDPPLLLWDEPTAGLDPSARRFTLDLIRELGRVKTVVVATHILSDIDQVASHVGVIHQGRMIFSGSMREMKRRLRRNTFSLELEGGAEQLGVLAERLSGLEGVDAEIDVGERLLVRIEEGRSRAGTLSQILQRIEADGMALQSIHSGRNETEDVYLQLLQEDEAHGFQRFDLTTEPSSDAVSGDPTS